LELLRADFLGRKSWRVGLCEERARRTMESSIYILCRRCLAISAALAVLLAAADSLAVVAYRLPEIQIPANPSGPTTGTFNVSVNAAPGDLPKSIGAFNLDFVVGGGGVVTLSPPAGTATSLIPAVNPLLSAAGPPENPFIINASPNAQTIRVAHDVMNDEPLMDGKNLVTVRFTVPAGTTGTFPLSFGAAQNNLLVDASASQIPLNLTDVGQISIVSAGVPGDYNSNGIVDAADYVVWRDRLGSTTTLPNEVSGVTPGSVTNEDYTAWRARLGRTSGSGAAGVLGAAAAVPEPSSWVAAGLLLALFAAGTRAAVLRRETVRPVVVLAVAGGESRRPLK
jgi:hypothetical protein